MANEKKNYQELLEHLEPDEEVISIVYGAYDTKIAGNDSIRKGIFAATNKRLIFYAKKMFGYDMEVFPYSNISSVEMGKELLGHKISFFSSGNKVTVKWIQSKEVMEFIKLVKEKIGKKHEASATPISSSTSMDEKTPIEKIKELKELLDMDIISKDEFEEKKKQLLEMI